MDGKHVVPSDEKHVVPSDEKHVVPSDENGSSVEKGIAPEYRRESVASQGHHYREQESFMTRNGLNLTSFKRRREGRIGEQLDHSMKTRHLHMIAIGGSIGAGFFVGSGSALWRGVRHELYHCIPSHKLTVQ
jgi:amino acid transporter